MGGRGGVTARKYGTCIIRFRSFQELALSILQIALHHLGIPKRSAILQNGALSIDSAAHLL